MNEPAQPDGIEVKVVVPWDALPASPRPDFYSQRNCDLLGLSKRSFLELLRRPDAPSVTRVGKLRLVRRDAMLAFLDELAEVAPRSSTRAELDGADRLLVELGCTPSTGTK